MARSVATYFILALFGVPLLSASARMPTGSDIIIVDEIIGAKEAANVLYGGEGEAWSSTQVVLRCVGKDSFGRRSSALFVISSFKANTGGTTQHETSVNDGNSCKSNKLSTLKAGHGGKDLMVWQESTTNSQRGGKKDTLEFYKNKIKMAGFYSAYPKRWISMVSFQVYPPYPILSVKR
ncbi:hypothetical protein Cgig2_005390 [Carnegiea gigantea]|uniref:Uncharacterized protein n=1 Tax=Carnegiea gigantea TaxID=171969 RepID=A0A9Q1GIX1_9CARY|nr:hypothetical protein Cgig2_005390 [Carnegiea gigantea]